MKVLNNMPNGRDQNPLSAAELEAMAQFEASDRDGTALWRPQGLWQRALLPTVWLSSMASGDSPYASFSETTRWKTAGGITARMTVMLPP